MDKNILPPWYPARRHLEPIKFAEFVDLLADFRRRLVVLGNMEFHDLNDPYCSLYELLNSPERWRAFKVIDYLDLTTWANERGVHLTGEFLGGVLFPHSEADIRVRVSQVTRPLAYSLLHKRSIDALAEISRLEPLDKVSF